MLPSFEELMDLALNEPDKLEKLRQIWVDETINNAPELFQRRLRGLQFQIDMEREKASNPVSACRRVPHQGRRCLIQPFRSAPQRYCTMPKP